MEEQTREKGITGSTLKVIAMVIMFIDHCGAIILEKILVNAGMQEIMLSENTERIRQFLEEYAVIYYTDITMRMIGRIAFPIFAFLLIEGFSHTHNIKKYARNLGIFALISEIPFNLAFANNPWDITYQNIFFTLFLALLVMIGFQAVEARFSDKKIGNIVLHMVILAAGAVAASLLKTDYGGFGVIVIAVMYLLRKNSLLSVAAGCVGLVAMTLNEFTSFLAMIPIKLYNGKRGLNLKYAFYLFYPVHILLLYGISTIM